MDPGVQTCEETLRLASGFVPRHGLADGANAAESGAGGAVRFRLSDPAQGRHQAARRPCRARPHDFTDLHAWAEVYLPGAGWVGLDPTSGLVGRRRTHPAGRHARSRHRRADHRQVEPCEANFNFSMSVSRIHEDPRVTKPYTEEAMAADRDRSAIKSMHDLDAGDVRLTMGGEPTFVSIDDMDGAGMEHAGAGHKTSDCLAGDLTKRLRNRFAPTGLLHTGQGKWYPGESLPRWALACYWRKDGKPIWHDSALLADDRTDYKFGDAEARSFIATLGRPSRRARFRIAGL